MSSRECPVCGKTIRLENVVRHYENVHPGKTVPPALVKEERIARESRRRAAPARSVRRVPSAAIVAIAIVLVLVGVAGAAYVLRGGSPGSGTDVVTYCGGEGTAQHYHPLLIVNVNGAQQHIPADIGVTNEPGHTNPSYYCQAGQLHALHTHDGSGIIHAELPGSITSTPSLGDFFTIWGEPLLPSQVWTFSGPVRATMYDMGTGTSTDYSANPRDIPMYAPGSGSDAHSIPQGLIFNGLYGNGDSNGMFSGEIIWLNVTR
jgi:hypothetical protein